jgi:hypothetical protein
MTRTERKNGGLSLWGINQDYWVRIGEEPFLNRKVLVICPWFGVFITRIYSPDTDRDPHDHSRPFLSLILSGGYTENVHSDQGMIKKTHRRWSAHILRTSEAHRITAIREPLRTLVIAGKSRGTWSFWTPAGKIDWKEYDMKEA